jgi:CheY-like chemotaxis protein
MTAEHGDYFEWIIHLTRGQLLDLVLEIEERLRRLIRAVLREKGDPWENAIPAVIRAKLEATSSSKASDDLLDRASLAQLIEIALARWKHFESYLGDKQKFRVKANEFREWRNSLAHGKTPSAGEKIEIAVVLRQVGQQIPVVEEPVSVTSTHTVRGSHVLWVDDHPEWNLVERQVFRALGIDVVPVLGNDEAIAIANEQHFDLVISDIDHGDDESGDLLPSRLHAVGIDIPILFFVGMVDPERDPPGGAHSITADPASLLRDALNLLSGHS